MNEGITVLSVTMKNNKTNIEWSMVSDIEKLGIIQALNIEAQLSIGKKMTTTIPPSSGDDGNTNNE